MNVHMQPNTASQLSTMTDVELACRAVQKYAEAYRLTPAMPECADIRAERFERYQSALDEARKVMAHA